MNDLFMARCQMGMSLAFHIVFAAIGIGLPLMMCIAEGLWLRTGEDVYHELAKRWSKIAAILFAVGAVSGTVLSFELGLLWPKFMEWSGEIIGLPFALEGFAFFTEAIFLGIYLYGWNLVPRAVHLASGVIVAISGLLSGLFVVLANGWMNTPTGFRIESAGKIIDPSVAASNPSLANFSLGKPVEIDPVAAMLNPAGLPEAIHMLFACYAATAFLFAGIHAYCLFKDKKNLFHRRAVAISLAVGAVMAILQPLTGDALAKMVAERQPVKLAAFESLFDTKYGAPLLIGGVPDVENAVVNYAIEIPHALSFLAYSDFNAKVKGLKEFPRELWPNIPIVHYCFQIMVASGMIMSLVSLWDGIHYVRRRKLLDTKAFLWSLTACAPLGFLAIETGWLVTEVGRQPWVIQGVMRTKDAVTPMPGLMVPFLTFTVLYLFLAVIVVFLIRRQVVKSPVIRDEQEPEVLPDPSVTPHANEDDMVEDAKTENASTDAGEASTNAGEASAEAEPAPADAKPPSVDGEPVPEDSKKDEP